MWSPRQWQVAAGGGILVALIVALPTAVIPNPIFGRAIGVTWWSYPVVVITGILGGMLIATYVRPTGMSLPATEKIDRESKMGVAGAAITFFAVGCPVCNKLVLLALGASGAISWFAPIQPFLAVASVVLMAIALVVRLRNQVTCQVNSKPSEATALSE
jgi:hypothetical protein